LDVKTPYTSLAEPNSVKLRVYSAKLHVILNRVEGVVPVCSEGVILNDALTCLKLSDCG